MLGSSPDAGEPLPEFLEISSLSYCASFAKEVENLELVVYEKESGIGGVWHNNTYPVSWSMTDCL